MRLRHSMGSKITLLAMLYGAAQSQTTTPPTTMSVETASTQTTSDFTTDNYYMSTSKELDCDLFDQGGTCAGYCNKFTDPCGTVCAPGCEDYGEDCGDFYEACFCCTSDGCGEIVNGYCVEEASSTDSNRKETTTLEIDTNKDTTLEIDTNEDTTDTKNCQVTYVSYIGDGWCDSAEYNNYNCNWDGGDCCGATCESSDLYDCGLNENGAFIGFNCDDPSVVTVSDECFNIIDEASYIGD
jgi:hypothetical protein